MILYSLANFYINYNAIQRNFFSILLIFKYHDQKLKILLNLIFKFLIYKYVVIKPQYLMIYYQLK